MATSSSIEIRYQLDGWQLFLERVEFHQAAGDALAALRTRTAERARSRHELPKLAQHATVAALRRLFRAAGCDPTRYRPSSEALLRRLLKGNDLPAIHPLVDINNCLSAELAVPCCVMAEDTFSFPLTLRSGLPGEAYDSLRGPFKLEGKPLLVDVDGPLDTPITGSQRVKVQPDSHRAWLAAYLPSGVVRIDEARDVLTQLLEQAPEVDLAP